MFGILAEKHMNQQQILAAEHETGCKLTKGNKKFQKCVSAWKKAHPALSVTSHCPCRVCARRMPRCSLGCSRVPKQQSTHYSTQCVGHLRHSSQPPRLPPRLATDTGLTCGQGVRSLVTHMGPPSGLTKVSPAPKFIGFALK